MRTLKNRQNSVWLRTLIIVFLSFSVTACFKNNRKAIEVGPATNGKKPDISGGGGGGFLPPGIPGTDEPSKNGVGINIGTELPNDVPGTSTPGTGNNDGTNNGGATPTPSDPPATSTGGTKNLGIETIFGDSNNSSTQTWDGKTDVKPSNITIQDL